MPRRRRSRKTEETPVASVAVEGRDRTLEIRLKRENSEWLDRHREELRREYPDRYVAVFDRRVAAQSEEFHEVLSALRKKSETAPAIAAIEFIDKDEVVWVL
jgi:hypothetical protein